MVWWTLETLGATAADETAVCAAITEVAAERGLSARCVPGAVAANDRVRGGAGRRQRTIGLRGARAGELEIDRRSEIVERPLRRGPSVGGRRRVARDARVEGSALRVGRRLGPDLAAGQLSVAELREARHRVANAGDLRGQRPGGVG